MDKYLSVITNFGCHYKCPYCIVRENDLQIPQSTVEGLSGICKAIDENQCNWVSVSGGGDPLFNWGYEFAQRWWRSFWNEVADAAAPVMTELHTSYIDRPVEAYDGFDRVVYHIRDVNQIKSVVRCSEDQIVRVVFVVTADFTPEKIDQITAEVRSNLDIDELSFRQMVDDHYRTTHYCEEYLRSGHQKDWWYIEQKDYNLYFCEGKVFTRFEDLNNG